MKNDPQQENQDECNEEQELEAEIKVLETELDAHAAFDGDAGDAPASDS